MHTSQKPASMVSFRARIALSLITILLAAVLFAPVPGDTHWSRMLHNSAHAPIFGCIALLALIFVRAHPRFGSIALMAQYTIALATAAVFGVSTEVLQFFIGRDATVEDAFHDVLGGIAFLGIFAALDAQVRTASRSHSIRVAAAVLGIAALVAAAAPATRTAIEYRLRDGRFPVLADFSRRFDSYFIVAQSAEFSRVRMPVPWAAAANETALRVRLLDGPYPGISFIEMSPDWSGYSTLAIDLTNRTQFNLLLALRVHDASHNQQVDDRFGRRVMLPASARQVIRIPLAQIAAGPRARTLDLRRVAGLIIFRVRESPPAAELLVSGVWLE